MSGEATLACGTTVTNQVQIYLGQIYPYMLYNQSYSADKMQVKGQPAAQEVPRATIIPVSMSSH